MKTTEQTGALPGELLPHNTLLLKKVVGDAFGPHGNKEYEMYTGIGLNPMVQSLKTGKTFVLSWQEIINMAVKKGIDND